MGCACVGWGAVRRWGPAQKGLEGLCLRHTLTYAAACPHVFTSHPHTPPHIPPPL